MDLDYLRAMKRGSLIIAAAVAWVATAGVSGFQAQQPPAATFRSGVDLVRVAAVVRDHKGRFVPDLSAKDFEILENGRLRPIADFRRDLSAVSVAVLFDVSGSMEGHLSQAREEASHVLSWLDSRDEAAVFTFDTELRQVSPFREGQKTVPDTMSALVPFGATSLHDAVAQTAQRVGEREGRRRGVVVLTDGNDNASRLTPAQVSTIASGIDVPVYIVGIVPSIDNPSADEATMSAERSALTGPLTDLANWTGGHLFVASTPSQRSGAARQIIDELRHQYLIAFESSGTPGWHPLEVRARQKDLTVRARTGYVAGQSRPSEGWQ